MNLLLTFVLVMADAIYCARGATGPTGATGAAGPAGATVATGVTYTPAVAIDWTNPDPTLVSGAFDDLASRVTAVEAESNQPLDATLTAVSNVTTVADTSIYFTGTDVAAAYTVTSAARSFLDDANASTMRSTLGLGTAATQSVGTSAGNLPQLDSSARLPAVDGSLLTGISSGAWDWAQGVPSVADWPDAVTYGGADEVCITSVLATGVKIRAGYKADCTTAWGSVDRAVGALRTIPSGDFRVAFRLQISRPGVARATGSSVLIAGPAFVDGTDAAANSWYGVGLYLSTSTLLNSEILALQSDTGAARWTTYNSPYPSVLASPSWPEVDYVLERTGTTLNIYAAPARGAGFLIASHTVTAAAGLIGLRSQVLLTSADEIDILLQAYRSGLTALPW